VVAVLDSGHRPVGSLMRGISVIGRIEDFEDCLSSLIRRGTRPDIVIVADPAVRGKALQNILNIATSQSIRVNQMPDISELRNAGQLSMKPVELGDLLSRDEATLDHLAMIRLISGKRVMVTGAGGSIGSELVRQIAKLDPAHITLAELSEYNLYEIDRYLSNYFPNIPRRAMIVDVRNRDTVEYSFASEQPDIVFHTAALKHVPLLESQPSQAILTNVLGTQNVADACVAHDVGIMVLVSTDKAAHPVSIMGATKRIAESYCQSLDLETGRLGKTRFITVRFGNVLGSAGSVVPLFQKQLAEGGPLTVTHRNMTRYFMTIREAVQLVLQAGTLSQGELERGRIVVLDMGEPVRILDLANQMIRLAGLRPDKDIKIVFTGLRPGERLTETLFQPDEELEGTSFKNLQVASAKVGDHAFIARMVEQLVAAAQQHNDEAALNLLEVAVADFASRRTEIQNGGEDISPPQHSEI
jgi:O-antigen biosynthesis protein WbqV